MPADDRSHSTREASQRDDAGPDTPGLAGGAGRVPFEAILDAAPDAMVVVDAEGTVTLVNEQAKRLFGYSRDELLGQSVEVLVPDGVRDRHVKHRHDYMQDPKPRPMGAGLDLHAVRKDGRRFPVEISLSPVDVDKGRVVIAAVRDITMRREEEEREARAREQRLELDRLRERDLFKTQFINNAAHELNTPLTTLLMQLRILREAAGDDLGPQPLQSLEVVERNAQRFARLVEDLLDAGRYQGGRLSIQRESVDLSAVVQEAVRDHIPAIRDQGLDLQADVRPGVMVEGDMGRLRQVLDNLIGNAMKFTGEGSIHVRLEADAHEATLEVQDTGRGFETDAAVELFQPFTRLDTGEQSPPGTGLGLYLCRAIVGLHGGRIAAHSDGPGKGATFTVRLPVAQSS